MKVLKTIFGLVVVGGAIYGVAYFFRQKRLIDGNTYKLKSVKPVSSITANRAKLSVTYTLTNNSDIPFTIWNQRYRGYVNGKPITEVSVDKKVIWNPRSSVDVEFPVEFNPSQVLNEIISTGAQTQIMIAGNVKVSSGFLLINNLPISLSFSLTDYIKS